MVDMKELRIGNYLMIDGTALPIGAGWFCLADRPNYIPEHKAIPITPEWLERMGFEGKYMEVDDYELQYDFNERELGILAPDGCTSGHTVYFRCHFVHNLQNIYFALTGKELEIKEIT